MSLLNASLCYFIKLQQFQQALNIAFITFASNTAATTSTRLMNSLQSQRSPLRANANFYQPAIRRRSSFGRRNFSQHHQTLNPILESPEPRNIIQYVGEVKKAKAIINRDFQHKEMYFPDPIKNMKKQQDMYSPRSRRSSFATLRPLQHRSIETERNMFLQTFRDRSQQKEDLHQTFYNTNRKSKHIMQKFYDDKCLTERSTPTFQNMLHRKIILQGILDEVKKSQRKFIHGF